MKKVLSLVLALAMVLGSFSFVSAADFADVTDATLAKAVDRLALLEVLTGYPDGSFKPEQTITRAEFAAVAVRAKGLEDAANAAKGLATGFTDVAAGNWAAGYVGTAGKLGIVNGVGNGLFAPNAPVKYEEAVTMIVRALGYEASAQTKGGYPYGYLIVANEIGLLDDVKGTQGMPASRGIVAQITDNALEIPKMIQVGFGADAKWVVSGSQEHGDETVAQLLLHDLGVDEIKGKVVNNLRTKSTVKKDEVEIANIIEGRTLKYEIAEGVDTDAVLGAGVTAWAKDDVIFSISVGYNFRYAGDKYVFTEDQIIYDSVDTKTDSDEVDLYKLDDQYDWANRARIFVNNESRNTSNVPTWSYGRFILNEDDEVEFAYLFEISNSNTGLTTSINEDELEFINVTDADDDVLALDDAEEIYVFNKNLSQASLDDIKENTAVFYWIDSDDNFYVVIDNNPLEGNLDAVRVRDNRITVAGKNITVKNAIFSSDDGEEFETLVANDTIDFETVEDYVDEDVVAYYTLAGDLLALVSDAKVTSGTIYGVATWLTSDRSPVLSVYTSNGEEVDYKFEDRDEAAITGVTAGGASGAQLKAKVTGVYFKVNKDGEIAEKTFGFVQQNGADTFKKLSDDKFGKINDAGNRLYITKDTVVFKALNGSGSLKPSVIKYDNIIEKEISAANGAIIKLGKGNDIDLLIFADQAFQGADDTEYGVVLSDPVRKGGDYVVDIDVYGEGKVTYTIARLADARSFEKGDLIKFTLNSKGELLVTNTATDVVDFVPSNGLTVSGKDGNYFTAGGNEYRRSTETVIYTVNRDGKFAGTGSYTNIKNGDKVLLIANANFELKAIIDLTLESSSSGSGGGIQFSVASGSLTVTGATYTGSTAPDYMVRITGDNSEDFTAVKSYADPMIFAITSTVIDKNGYYTVELINVNSGRVEASESRLFLYR